MALTAEQLDRLSIALVSMYEAAELAMLERIAHSLASGIAAPDWQLTKLNELQLLIGRERRLLADLAGLSSREIADAIMKAYNLGQASAMASTAMAANGPSAASVASAMRVRALVAEATMGIVGSHGRILRSFEDIYSTVIADASGVAMLGVETRRQAAQRALDRFANQGVVGFTDRLGRQWEARSYVEMSMRTTIHKASIQGHVDRLQQRGHDLVIVSDHSQECELCRPWEGKVLSISGIRHVEVRTAGTLAEAEAAGLFHPGCRHTIGAYFPGVTEAPTRTADPEGDAARQEQRRLERGVRAWKRRDAASLTPEAKRQAHAKAREWAQRLREWEASHDLKHQGFRSSVSAAR